MLGDLSASRRMWILVLAHAPLPGSVLLESNGGSLSEPPFTSRRQPPDRDHAGRGPRVPHARLRRRRHARHRARRQPLPRQPVSLLPRQGRAPLLLSGPLARPAARRAGRGTPGSPAAGRPAARPGGGPRPLPARRGRRLRGASGSGCAAAGASPPHRRKTRPLRARRPRDGGRRHPPPHPARVRFDHCHARLSRRAELDGTLVPSRRTP